MSAAIASGFASPVFDAQAVFRVVLQALARPGIARDLPCRLDAPAPLTPELAAIALALADTDAPLWLDPALAASPAVLRYLRFHTGAAIVSDPAEAAFALIANPARSPRFAVFASGSDLYPDRSTTIVMAVDAIAAPGEGGLPGAPAITLQGPGIKGQVAVSAAPLPETFLDDLRSNHARFPRGIDCLLAAPGRVLGIPRSSIAEAR
jgi:alpha-D-ribose 1-methylphosphonate 5-triphosphate synthase subunit PhnH